jgi:ABC-type multidrug transport system fused ATPase/permease subunit
MARPEQSGPNRKGKKRSISADAGFRSFGLDPPTFSEKLFEKPTYDVSTVSRKNSGMSLLRRLALLFTRSDLMTIGILVLLMMLNALLETFGIGMLYPYVAVLQDPAKIHHSAYLSAIYGGFGFESERSFSIAMSGGLLAIFILKAFFSLYMTNFQLRFIYAKQLELGQGLFTRYLYQPYAFFLAANASTLIGNLTTSVVHVCSGIIEATLSLSAEAIVLTVLVIFLVYISPAFSLAAMVFIAAFSLIFFRLVKPSIARYGFEYDEKWKAMLRVTNEGISAAKEVQMLARQQFFIDTYDRESRVFAWAIRRYSLLRQLPRFSLETGAVAAMVLFAVVALLTGGLEKELFSVLAVFAVATIRIVPSMNRVLQAGNAISFYWPAINVVARGLIGEAAPATDGRKIVAEFRFRRTLSVSIKSFDYPTNPHFRLKDINLVIQQGRTVAFIGRSGSGKTTLIDLILGFFPDFRGEIAVDGYNIKDHLSAWRRRVGYIPQNLYLRDDTITRNVAFGIPDRDIDTKQVRRAVTLAGLDHVIEAQSQGLDTIVGDRGIRLSGGERQRIGIARALYHDPDLLVLDEATSALDNETERQIVDSIIGLSPAKTIIIVAHRLSTVRRCDVVFLMHDGQIIDRGPLAQITERHSEFAIAQ